jgi:hypothetical protein
MIAREHTQKFIYLLVVMNLVVLLVVFILPRIQFMLENSEKDFSQIQETQGTRDLPNQFYLSYRIANQVDRMIPKTAAVFLPPKEYPGAFRSAMVQVLFPRRVFSADMEDFADNFKNLQPFPQAYLVFSPDWHADFCLQETRIALNDLGWGLCKLK